MQQPGRLGEGMSLKSWSEDEQNNPPKPGNLWLTEIVIPPFGHAYKTVHAYQQIDLKRVVFIREWGGYSEGA